MDINVANKTNKSWEVVYVMSGSCSVRLFHLFGGGRYRQMYDRCSVLCCNVIDACTTSNDV